MAAACTRTSAPLYQSDAVAEIAKLFGDEYTYTNENGNAAIDKRILTAFRKITGNTVVWERWDFCWRKREAGDTPGASRNDPRAAKTARPASRSGIEAPL